MKNRKISVLVFLCMLLSSQIVSGQAKMLITGKILDSLDYPVRGAQIFADNVSCNTLTNSNGEYEVEIDLRVKEISVLTRTGYTWSVKVDGRKSIDLILPAGHGTPVRAKKVNPRSMPADEKVNAGYHDTKQSELSTPVTTVEKKKDAVYQSIYDMLRATPGVQVSGRRITIRGASSINGSSDPLLILDGAPVTEIDHISPEMVRTIDVLKGSSASIYGVRGASGVIVINLKK